MPWSVRLRLTHASIQGLAEDSGIDLLHIKGPAVDESLLEVRQDSGAPTTGQPQLTVPRHSADVDVLVRPSHVDRLLAVMHRHGWETAYRFEDGSAFEHAATMTHAFLAPVDVHRRFPGIDAPGAFERFWADRHMVTIAGLPCSVPSVTAQRLLLIVHAARGGAIGHLDIRRSWGDATDEQRTAVQELAVDAGAEVALAAGTGRLRDYAGSRGYELWQALSIGETSQVRLWVARVKAEPTRRAALRAALRLVLPKPRRMEMILGRPPTGREMVIAYWRRGRRGWYEVRTILRARFHGSRGDR